MTVELSAPAVAFYEAANIVLRILVTERGYQHDRLATRMLYPIGNLVLPDASGLAPGGQLALQLTEKGVYMQLTERRRATMSVFEIGTCVYTVSAFTKKRPADVTEEDIRRLIDQVYGDPDVLADDMRFVASVATESLVPSRYSVSKSSAPEAPSIAAKPQGDGGSESDDGEVAAKPSARPPQRVREDDGVTVTLSRSELVALIDDRVAAAMVAKGNALRLQLRDEVKGAVNAALKGALAEELRELVESAIDAVLEPATN